MTVSAAKILVIDDEAPIRKLLRVGLATQNYAVVEAGNGKTANIMMAEEKPDLVILDLGLPDMSGLDLLSQWREAGNTVPIIILSSRTDETGIVKALDGGADDYVTKPFGMNELIARIHVALKHRLHQQGETPVFRTGALSVDLIKRIVKLGESEIKLSPKEYEILRLMVQYSGKVLTHKFILNHVWPGDADIQYLRIYIRQLRHKLEKSPDQPVYILTETGVGYRLRTEG